MTLWVLSVEPLGGTPKGAHTSERRRPAPANARPSPAASPVQPNRLREVAVGAPRLARRTKIAVRRCSRCALEQADIARAHTRRTLWVAKSARQVWRHSSP